MLITTYPRVRVCMCMRLRSRLEVGAPSLSFLERGSGEHVVDILPGWSIYSDRVQSVFYYSDAAVIDHDKILLASPMLRPRTVLGPYAVCPDRAYVITTARTIVYCLRSNLHQWIWGAWLHCMCCCIV